MKGYHYTISGIRNETQSNAGQRQECYWCVAYNDAQALAWAEKSCGKYLYDFRIEDKHQ